MAATTKMGEYALHFKRLKLSISRRLRGCWKFRSSKKK